MEKKAADLLAEQVISSGVHVERQGFYTPKTYIWEVVWLTVLIAAGLVLVPFFSWFSVGALFFCTLSAFLMFDWRASPLAFLSPKVPSENIIGKMKEPGRPEINDGINPLKLVLMAHYDTAPVSLLYLPSLVKNFRSSLLINLFLIVMTLPVSTLQVVFPENPMILWTGRILAFYFLIQGWITAFDYFRYGYTNGAADNATGTAAAMITAHRLWKNPVPGVEVTLVLTGAEETGMTGAKHYFNTCKDLTPHNSFVVNFDNLGKGDIKIITKTGSITMVEYKNRLVDSALGIAGSDSRFQDIQPASWHTGDFDTLWFARAGIPCLTLTAQDANGCIPNLHRPEDIKENIDESVTSQAIDFAEALIRRAFVRPKTSDGPEPL
jgi:hypothetical protein